MIFHKSWILVLVTFTQVIITQMGCQKEVTRQDLREPDIVTDFEVNIEPFEKPADRPIDPEDDGNGCLSGTPWNLYWIYNVCISPTVEMNDFSIERTTRFVRSGEHAMRFYLKPTPLDQWPLGEATHRAELAPREKSPFPRYPREGEERWYGFSVLFPEEFVFAPVGFENDLRFMFAQWQHGSEGSPAIALEVHGDKIGVSRSEGVSLDTRFVPPVFIGNITKGKWMDFVLQIKWSKTDGFARVWVNDQLRYEEPEIQTIYNNLDIGGGFKIGIYHWRWKIKESVQNSLAVGITSREIYMDEIREFLGNDAYDVVAPH
ncbi:MAG: heparin lyase I family protein [Saprospiraceae bacterium]|nr:heparin lyase I family protein [Saprospiraceae bacterium]